MRHRLVVGCAVLILGALPALGSTKSASSSKRVSSDGDFRVVRITNPDGSVTLELTNLDSEGRRLGGELTHADRIRLWGAPKPAPEPEVVEVPTVPVVVNIYQMGPGGAGSGETIVGGTYPGFFPGFFPIPGMGGDDPDHNRRDGNLPPATFFSSADPHRRAIEVKPYTRGTARQRNKRFFRRN